MADSSLNFLQDELATLDAINRQVTTSAELEAEASIKVDQSVTEAAQRDKIIAASNTLMDTQKDLIGNSSVLAGLAAQMDTAIQSQQKGINQASGADLKTAQIAEQFNAPARENYNEAVSDPVIDASIKRYRSQVNIYTEKLALLQNDTSFMGNLKRMSLEGINQKKLAEANANLKMAQGRKIDAVQVFNASVQGGALFAQTSTAVERQVIADSLVRAESAGKLISSKMTLTDADRRVIGDTLQLDATRVGIYEKEYAYMKERGIATDSNMAALKTKLGAQQSQERALKLKPEAMEVVQVTTEWNAFIKDSITGTAEQAEFLKQFPDPLSSLALNTSAGATFWQARANTGTKNEFAKTALIKREKDMNLTDIDYNALRLMDSGVAFSRKAIIAQYETDLTGKGGFQKEAELKATRDAALKNLAKPDVQAKFYETALNSMKSDASTGITSGSIIMPDWKERITDPTFKYSGNISEKFKAILTSPDFVTVDMGMTSQQDPTKQLQSIAGGIADYIVSQGVKDAFGRLSFDGDTQLLISHVTQGAADYYKSVRQMNNQSNMGLGSDVLPAIMIPNVGINGKAMNLESSVEWEQLIRLALKRINSKGDSTIKALKGVRN